jgi:HAD superfamily hydrolase (TIGR01490 family)
MEDASDRVAGLAFYDFDGTIVAGNVVQRYAFLAWRHSDRQQALMRCVKLLVKLPLFVGLDRWSRRRFNEVFFREYRGLTSEQLGDAADLLFEQQIRPRIRRGARAAIAADRARGHRLVLLSGEVEHVLQPAARALGFDEVVCNRLVFSDGISTGQVAAPLVAEAEKAAAVQRLCRRYGVPAASARAYSDSLSDLPMLEAVGWPAVVNPEPRIRRTAIDRGWPILDWGANAPG